MAAVKNDGVVNPSGLITAGVGVVFLAAVPVTSYLATPGGYLQTLVDATVGGVSYVGTFGASSTISPNRILPALSALYIFVTYALSGAASVAGVAASTEKGRDNNHPRAQVSGLRGLPLRLHSAHYNLMEMFPGFALTAALAQTLAPGDRQIINLLGLHVLSKVFLYYPSYLLNIGLTRSIAHLLATSSVINVAWKLAQGAI